MNSIKADWHVNPLQLLLVVLKVFVVSVIFIIFFLTYKLFTLLIPSILSIVLICFLLYKLVVFVSRLFTFPGHAWFWRRNSENHFRKAFVIKIKRRISVLRGLVEYLLENRLWHNFIREEEFGQIRRVISLVMNLYTKQTTHGTMTKRQQEMMDLFSELETLLFETTIINKSNEKKHTVLRLIQADRNIIEDIRKPTTFLFFEERARGEFLLEKIKVLEKKLDDIVCDKPIVQKVKRWIYDDTFGSLDQLREELDNRYQCKRIPIKVEKNVVIDCVLVSNKDEEAVVTPSSPVDPDKKSDNFTTNRNEQSADAFQVFTLRNQGIGSVIILCCPNAGYYECMHYENNWIGFYIKNGLKVLLWNYRGYGKSTGTPSPDGLRADGEAIVDYLRGTLRARRIGVHGESLGGLVATHLARKKQLDFLCADRTFMNLSNVGQVSFGHWVGKFYQMITLWDSPISTDYVQAKCYKVLTYDPRDEIIHSLSSLKYGVTKKALETKLGFSGEPVKPDIPKTLQFCSPRRLLTPFKKIKFSIEFALYRNKINQTLKNNYCPLTKSQSIALFHAISRVSELFIELSSYHGLNILKQQSKIFKPMNPRAEMKSMKPIQARNNSIDSPPLEGDSENICVDETVQNVKVGLIHEDLKCRDKAKTDGPVLDMKTTCYEDEAFLLKSAEKKSYLGLFDEVAKNSDDVVCLLLKVYPVLESLEAGGIQISDIFGANKKHQFDFFKFYIQSFDVWGSYFPINKIIEDQAQDISYHQQQAINKLNSFSTKLEQVLENYKSKETENSTEGLSSNIIEDLELILSVITSMLNQLMKDANKYAISMTSKLLNELESGQEDITVNNPTVEKMGSRTNKLINSKKSNNEDADSTSSIDLGHLLPLTCGHNGSLKPHEMEIYEYHLKRAKLV